MTEALSAPFVVGSEVKPSLSCGVDDVGHCTQKSVRIGLVPGVRSFSLVSVWSKEP